jgi:formylglycine-generating enzyme required for sulfatase activity
MGEGGAGRGERAAVSVGRHDFLGPGELLPGGDYYPPYDVNPTTGYDPQFDDEVYPYTSPAAYFAPNGYGLYDMAGNVYQWCWDWYGAYLSGPQTDPQGPASGSYRVRRGGGWDCGAPFCRAAFRACELPIYCRDHHGFHSVLPADQP